MPVPTHADFNAMTHEDVASLKESENPTTAARAVEHDNYRIALHDYGNDCKSKSLLGLGSNPPTPPPPPPGT